MDPDAVPMSEYLDRLRRIAAGVVHGSGRGPAHRRGPQLVVLVVISAFLIIEAFGLCSTYGQWPFH